MQVIVGTFKQTRTKKPTRKKVKLILDSQMQPQIEFWGLWIVISTKHATAVSSDIPQTGRFL